MRGDQGTGEADATREMYVDSGTEGGPLELGPAEDPDRLVHEPRRELAVEDPHMDDWCTHL